MSSDNDIELILAILTPDINFIKLPSMPHLLCKNLLWMSKIIHCLYCILLDVCLYFISCRSKFVIYALHVQNS